MLHIGTGKEIRSRRTSETGSHGGHTLAVRLYHPSFQTAIQDIMSSGDPQEEDIGESSSILTLTSTGGSTCNTPPPGHSPTPILSRPPFLFNAPRTSQDLSQKKSLGQSLSPSSPNLVKAARPRGLSRSQTLPRGFQAETTSKRGPSEIDGLTMDSDVSAKLRRWIMGIAIGVCGTSTRLCAPLNVGLLQLILTWIMGLS